MENKKTQIKVIFSVFGDIFSPSDFTKYIGINPHEVGIKGEEIKKGLLRKESSWEYTIGFIETVFLDDVSNIYTEIFENKAHDIRKYTDGHNLEAKIFVVIEMDDQETPALFFDKKFLNVVHQLNAVIDVDLYRLY